jgi:hypothetical protein
MGSSTAHTVIEIDDRTGVADGEGHHPRPITTRLPTSSSSMVADGLPGVAAERFLRLAGPWMRVPVDCEHGFRLIVNIQSS